MPRAKRIESYGRDVMIKIILDVIRSDWPEEFKKHILLKELLWKADAPKGVKGDNSQIVFSSAAKSLWQKNEREGIKPKSGIVIEHAIPRLEIYAALSKQKKTSKTSISNTLEKMIIRVAVTKEEDTKLNKLGLRQRMPDGWDGIDPLARHRAAKIQHAKWLPEQYKTAPYPPPNKSMQPTPCRCG
jgi:hypothetical protein